MTTIYGLLDQIDNELAAMRALEERLAKLIDRIRDQVAEPIEIEPIVDLREVV